MWFLGSDRRDSGGLQPSRRWQYTELAQYTLARQRGEIQNMKRERWTEEELIRLPTEEPDIFDRKSGLLLNKEDDFLNAVAKALSAFANSGGGSLLLGVTDDGILDGLPKTRP
jgi:hypothetical protein